MGRVLVVDDDQAMRDLVRDSLGKSFDVSTAASAAEGLQAVREVAPDCVVTDIELGGVNGLELCEQIVAARPDLPVVVVTAYGSMDTAIAALRVGAHDFVNKPLDMSAFSNTVKRAVEHKLLRDELKALKEGTTAPNALDTFIGESAGMKKVYRLVREVAPTDASVLVTGESGTGKELVARALHDNGPRADGPFIAINCAAMPAALLESELFGHVRGAFTDAKTSRDGLFVQADGGTLFLDEIGEMPLEMQAKLLRVLQESAVRPIGGAAETEFDTRIVAATNRDLESEVEDGTFREDLFYRIHVVKIEVPPLRSRGRDVLLLAQHFIEDVGARIEKSVSGISPAAAHKLLEYDWPGNVRELQNVVERAVTLTQTEDLEVADLPDKVQQFESKNLVVSGANPDEMPTLLEMEQRYIRRVLEAVGGNKSHAARVLGLDRRTLYRKLEKFEDGQQ